MSALRVLRRFHTPVHQFPVCSQNVNAVDLVGSLSLKKYTGVCVLFSHNYRMIMWLFAIMLGKLKDASVTLFATTPVKKNTLANLPEAVDLAFY